MKKLFTLLIVCHSFWAFTQPKQMTETVELKGQETLRLDLPFADVIQLETWDKNQIQLEVTVEINGGENNDFYVLDQAVGEQMVAFTMNMEWWEEKSKGKNSYCNNQVDISYRIQVPNHIKVNAKTISGNFEMDYYGQPFDLNTISGDVDVAMGANADFSFQLSTLTGGVYSDLELDYPKEKNGLVQIVGTQMNGRLNEGSLMSKFETISGDIYLREKK